MAIPVNETWLGIHNWTNGTLDGHTGNQWTPVGNDSQSVNLTILPDNLAAIQFLATDEQAFQLVFAMARTVLSSDYFSGRVYCAYPISGMYDFLTRILFYVLLLFALLFRRHSWLAVAALGTAMTYSATVAVHALALLTQFGWHTGYPNIQSSQPFGDIDILGAQVVLTAALVMMTPILNWSTSVRRDRAQIIVVLWGLLIFVAWAPATVYVSSQANGKAFHPWSKNLIPALFMCPLAASKVYPYCNNAMELTRDNYDNCQCFDFCGLIGPTAPMRSGAKMVAWLIPQAAIDRVNSTTYNEIEYFSQTMAVVIVLYGAFGLLLNQFSLRQMRNFTFRFFNTHLTETRALSQKVLLKLFRRNNNKFVDPINDDTKTGLRKWQYWFAKTMALIFFLLGLLIAFISPLTLVAVVITNEYDISPAMFSEGHDAVGAWSSWVGAVLVLGVAAILRYQDAWELFFLGCGDALLRLFGITTFEQRLDVKKEDQSIKKGKRNWFKHYAKSIAQELWSPCVHVRHSICMALASIVFACAEFRDWIMTPGPHSQICGCEGCIAYRAQDRGLRLRMDQVDYVPIEEHANLVLKKHLKLRSGCGCHLCYFAGEQDMQKHDECPCRNCERDRKEEAKKIEAARTAASGPEESKEYQTLGMRILQRFDERIRDMLMEASSVPPHPAGHASVHKQPTTSTISTSADDTNSATSVGISEPL